MTHKFMFTWMFAACILAANIYFCRAQDIIKVKDAHGVAYISGDVSENQAKQRAINEAKINALKKAHIVEHVNASELLLSSQVNNDFSQFFNSDIQSEIQGAVTTYTITNEDKKVNPNINQIEYSIVIDADVIKYKTQSDFEFKSEVDNVLPVYKSADNLKFSIKTTQDCYLTIFNITDHDASMMFPNIIEKDQKLQKETNYQFPLKSNLLDYTLETDKTDEVNRLVFVFTKTRMPYLAIKGDEQLTDNEKIMTWIYSIPPDQRCTVYKQFHILK
jgi:hypothetical protein